MVETKVLTIDHSINIYQVLYKTRDYNVSHITLSWHNMIYNIDIRIYDILTLYNTISDWVIVVITPSLNNLFVSYILMMVMSDLY